MVNDNGNSLKKINDVVLLTLVIYGEARNQSIEGMLAVGSVVLNRLRRQSWYGKTLRDVILKPLQFSCFNEDDPKTPRNEEDPNRDTLERIAFDLQPAMMNDPALRTAYWVATGILDNYLGDNVGGATHYRRKDCNPAWDDDPKTMKFVKQIQDHVFYKEA